MALKAFMTNLVSDRPSHNDKEVKSVVKTRFLNQAANYTKMELKLSFELF